MTARRNAVVAAVLAGGCLAAGSPALAVTAPSGATVDARPSTTHLRYPAQRGYAIAYTVQTAGSAETVTIRQGPPAWPGRDVIGSPIELRDPRLIGPGRLSVSSSSADYAFGACLRGSSDGAPVVLRLTLGPNQRTTIVEPVRITAPPWPRARFVPRVSVGFASDGGGQQVRLPLANVRVTGRTGVHIRLASRHPRLRQDRFPGPVLAPGRTIAIGGSTEPAVEHARIRVTALVYAADRSGFKDVRIGVARTDAAGRFRLDPWLPPFDGDYLVEAAYRHPRAGLLADRTCDLHFTVGGAR